MAEQFRGINPEDMHITDFKDMLRAQDDGFSVPEISLPKTTLKQSETLFVYEPADHLAMERMADEGGNI